MKAKAKTAEEVREEFLRHISDLVEYWDSESRAHTLRERLDGLAFSILNIFDGTTTALPAFNISCAPHPDDKEFSISNGEDWYEDGLVINDCSLHELWYRNVTPAKAGKDAR